jgi:hypothetical protein
MILLKLKEKMFVELNFLNGLFLFLLFLINNLLFLAFSNSLINPMLLFFVNKKAIINLASPSLSPNKLTLFYLVFHQEIIKVLLNVFLCLILAPLKKVTELNTKKKKL